MSYNTNTHQPSIHHRVHAAASAEQRFYEQTSLPRRDASRGRACSCPACAARARCASPRHAAPSRTTARRRAEPRGALLCASCMQRCTGCAHASSLTPALFRRGCPRRRSRRTPPSQTCWRRATASGREQARSSPPRFRPSFKERLTRALCAPSRHAAAAGRGGGRGCRCSGGGVRAGAEQEPRPGGRPRSALQRCAIPLQPCACPQLTHHPQRSRAARTSRGAKTAPSDKTRRRLLCCSVS